MAAKTPPDPLVRTARRPNYFLAFLALLAGAFFFDDAAAFALAFFPRLKAASQPVAYLAFVPMRVMVIVEASGWNEESAGKLQRGDLTPSVVMEGRGIVKPRGGGV